MGKKAAYGRGHPRFLEYVRETVAHPAYAGMPDVYLDDGEIQWEAPSNRQGGKFKDTHLRRLEWWRRKAIEIGIDPGAGAGWISQTAKRIHPTKKKPCKSCGRILDIRYRYPSEFLLARIRRLPYYDESFPLDPLEDIATLLARLVEQFGDRVFRDLRALLRSRELSIPKLGDDLAAWKRWIDEEYVPHEPSTLSPGAMSNAPDRLDGFHSFNRCCRSSADRGRHKQNLLSYTTDRRVFEYWVDGDWVAADRLMGLVRSDARLKQHPCRNGHKGPCSADHVGPISLGFAHRPLFQLLCRSCNSTKNNRMALSDVVSLRAAEARGEQVASWYVERLWKLRRDDVDSNETALRLSKMMRDNRHSAMHVLHLVRSTGHSVFLASLLGLEYADRNVEFEDVRVEGGVVAYGRMRVEPRETKYAVEQKARRLRVAMLALDDYVEKESRNALLISTPEIKAEIKAVLKALLDVPREIMTLDKRIDAVLDSDEPSEEALRVIVAALPSPEQRPPSFAVALDHLKRAADLIGEEISRRWTDERYVRASDDLD